MGGITGSSGPAQEEDDSAPAKEKAKSHDTDDLAAIKKQLADLQSKLSKL